MRKGLLVLSVTLLTITAYSQTPVDTADLRTKINSWLVPNSNREITALKVNQLFNGVANLMKAYAVDSAYRINDTLFLTRKNGFQTIKVLLAKDTSFANSDFTFDASGSANPNLLFYLKKLPQSTSSSDSILVKTTDGLVKTRAQSAITGAVTFEQSIINNNQLTQDRSVETNSNHFQITDLGSPIFRVDNLTDGYSGFGDVDGVGPSGMVVYTSQNSREAFIGDWVNTDAGVKIKSSEDNSVNEVDIIGRTKVAVTGRVAMGDNPTFTPSAALEIRNTNTGAQAVGTLLVKPTWNTSGAPSALTVDVTNTASASSSLIASFVSGLNGFNIAADGRVLVAGRVSLNNGGSVTGQLHIGPGSTAAGSAPVKLSPSNLMTTPENGAIELSPTHLYVTIAGTRYQLDQQQGATPTWQQTLTAGSTLTSSNTITAGTNTQNFTSTNTTVAGWNFSNTGNGSAISTSSTGTGASFIAANSSSGSGIQASSVSGMGLNAISTSGTAGRFKITPTSTNTTERVVNFIRGISGGTAANNMGGSIGLQLTDDGGNDYAASQITWYQTNASSVSRTTSLGLSTTNAGSNATKLLINGPGQIRFPLYNSTTFDNYDVTAPGLVIDASGNVGTRPAGNWAQISTGTVTNTTTETTILNSGAGSLTVPSSAWVVGATYEVEVHGDLSTDGSNPAQSNFRLKFGSTTIASTGNIFNGTGTNSRDFTLKAIITCRTTGASGTVMAVGKYIDENESVNPLGDGTTASFDMTTSQTFDITAQMNNAGAGNTINTYNVTFKRVN